LPNVRVVGVGKKYKDIDALRDVSLEIRDQEYVSIIGPSGCGKSTLLKCIAGIIRQDSGQIFIGDREVSALPPEERQLGYMFQEIALFPQMTSWDNIGYGPRVRGKNKALTRQFVGQVMELARLKIGRHTYPDELSGGARQKTALARAIAAEPQLLLLDEPLGALDAHVRAVLRYELRRLVNELGLTAIHVTHDQEEAMSISDRLVIMKAGQMIEVGTPLELYLSPKRLFTANFLGETNFIPAEVEDCGQGRVTAVANGWSVNSRGTGFTEGEGVVLTVRPESVIVAPLKQADRPWVGTVREHMLLGDCLRTEIELDNGLRMIAQTINQATVTAGNLGERVSVDFVKDGLIAYQIPAHGLDVELALE